MDATSRIEHVRRIRARVRNLTIEHDKQRTKSFKEIVAMLDELIVDLAHNNSAK